MLALTEVLLELLTPYHIIHVGGRAVRSDTLEPVGASVVNRDVPIEPTNIGAAALGAKVANKVVSAGPANIGAAVKTATTESPSKHELMRRTFNALPNKGRDLHIAGKGQSGIINPAHQRIFDAMYKKIASEQTPGVPAKVVHKAATVAGPEHTDITAGQAANILVKKGAHAVGDAVTATGNAVASGVKGIAQHVTEHPLATAGTLAAGAAGALGLRKLINRNKPA